MQIPIKARWESAVEALQAVTEQESLFDTFLLCGTKNAKRVCRPIVYALSSDFLSVLFTLLTWQAFAPKADHPFISSADTHRQRFCNIPHFGMWIHCQVCLDPFVVVRHLFIVTLSCGLLSDARPLFAFVCFLFPLWRW